MKSKSKLIRENILFDEIKDRPEYIVSKKENF